MSKVILVMEKPEGCEQCGICNKGMEKCPLRPLPEKRKGSTDKRRPDSYTLKAWIKGWNDCLSSLEGKI